MSKDEFDELDSIYQSLLLLKHGRLVCFIKEDGKDVFLYTLFDFFIEVHLKDSLFVDKVISTENVDKFIDEIDITDIFRKW